eukprot:CAMPEP_0185749288 /NCGR_PEP_ID=MMETSP1174-20130828/8021_1 /TAXON_ID=35687 /ORGANISM="Dictyocha speculum, Strain CCMP1381" /LENGTH=637 /DNA_ID=CAMNT_0028425343 /DNA_START=93 /DNA_END=2008 /DNA_ORIENTATION=+
MAFKISGDGEAWYSSVAGGKKKKRGEMKKKKARARETASEIHNPKLESGASEKIRTGKSAVRSNKDSGNDAQKPHHSTADTSLEALESRLFNTWGAVADDDFYDPDDEGYDSGPSTAAGPAVDAGSSSFMIRPPPVATSRSGGSKTIRASSVETVRKVKKEKTKKNKEAKAAKGVEAKKNREAKATKGDEARVVPDNDDEQNNAEANEVYSLLSLDSVAAQALENSREGVFFSALNEEEEGGRTSTFIELLKECTSGNPDSPAMSAFDRTERLQYLADNVEDMVEGDQPTRIQAEVASEYTTGGNLLITAATGSGKTLAYLLPLVANLEEAERVQVLVLAPGRELAAQISRVCAELTDGLPFRVLTLIGGANLNRQLERIKKTKPQVIVGTPGRIAELALLSNKLKLSGVRAIVLDEADAMLESDAITSVRAITKAVPKDCQRIVASASGLSKQADLEDLVLRPLTILGGSATKGSAISMPANVGHGVVVDDQRKHLSLVRSMVFTMSDDDSGIVFVRDSKRVDLVVAKLLENGIIAGPLHGDMPKNDRAEVVKRLYDGRLHLVVTTEMAARGLDAPLLTHVVNLDLPTDGTPTPTALGGQEGLAGPGSFSIWPPLAKPTCFAALHRNSVSAFLTYK